MTGDQEFKKQDVELGVSDGINVEVLSGVKMGDKIKVWNQIKPAMNLAQN